MEGVLASRYTRYTSHRMASYWMRPRETSAEGVTTPTKNTTSKSPHENYHTYRKQRPCQTKTLSICTTFFSSAMSRPRWSTSYAPSIKFHPTCSKKLQLICHNNLMFHYNIQHKHTCSTESHKINVVYTSHTNTTQQLACIFFANAQT